MALLQDKVCIVTGASRGIGRDTAYRLAAEGAILLLASRVIATAEETAAGIRAKGGRASAFAADVTNPDAMQALVDHCEALHGRLDLAFNNAGRLVGSGKLHEIPLDQYRTHIDTNLGGAFYSLRAQLALMVRGGSGAIVVNSAGSGVRPRPNVADYSASKMGVIGLCQAAAQEYGPLGIRINVVTPGYIGTESWMRILGSRADALAANVPLRRIGVGAEVAEVVLFLLSEQARYVTGAVVPVDGGLALA